MELKDEPDELAAFMRQLIIAQMQHRLRFDGNSPRIGGVEQTENIEQRALAAARWADNSVDAAWLQIERDTAQRMDALLLFAQVTLERFATEANFRIHRLDPRRVTTGGSSAARRAGT